jgi:hypothetical protein
LRLCLRFSSRPFVACRAEGFAEAGPFALLFFAFFALFLDLRSLGEVGCGYPRFSPTVGLASPFAKASEDKTRISSRSFLEKAVKTAEQEMLLDVSRTGYFDRLPKRTSVDLVVN